MPIRKKAAVSAIFLLGAFIVGVSAARIFIFVDVGREEGTDLDKSCKSVVKNRQSQLQPIRSRFC